MSEVSGPIHGDFNYTNLKGDTGPLVYPAGFVYFYSLLYFITDEGNNILLAQYLFLGFYLIYLSLVLNLYSYMKYIPPYYFIIIIDGLLYYFVYQKELNHYFI